MEIKENPSLYKSEFVEECLKEIEIREESWALRSQTEAKSTRELEEILNNPELYNEALIRCSRIVLEDRSIEEFQMQRATAFEKAREKKIRKQAR